MRGLAVVAVLMALLAGCSGLGVLDGLTTSSGYSRTEGLAYGKDPRQRLDIYRPDKPLPDTPVVVFFYGGSWNRGDRADYRFVGRALARRGMLAVVADYRLYPQVRYPAFIDDSAQATAWVYRHIGEYGGDNRRLFLMGHSAGAYNAAMVALQPQRLAAQGLSRQIVRGWIGLAGPYDFLPIEEANVKPVFFFPASPPQSQPINQPLAGSAPALLIAANNDSVVNPQRNTAGLARQLRAAGVPVEEQYYGWVNHVTLIATLAPALGWLAPVMDRVEAFILQAPAIDPGGAGAK